ncbi:MAG: DUF2911 domain-containing protein [Bacteroidetes bacterium]|jgi:hypothetical protein|nr:DUF2911 domain-containing protein [Bacteroidota bacterium]
MKIKFLLLFVVAFGFNSLQAQEFPKVDVSPMDAVIVRTDNNQSFMRVIYSRPQKKGRNIFGDLVPYGKVWRTGANEATEITFYKDVKFGGKTVEAGTYSLFTIPNKDKWTVIINEDVNLWGAYQYDSSKDVVRVVVNPKTTAATVETFSITSKKADKGYHLLLGWDDTYVEVPVY